jgi:hypothetical protein
VLHHGFVHGVEMMKKGPESAAVRWFSKMVPKIERWAPSTREVRQDRGGNLESWPMVLLTACVYHAQTRERGLAAVYLRQANDYRSERFSPSTSSRRSEYSPHDGPNGNFPFGPVGVGAGRQR